VNKTVNILLLLAFFLFSAQLSAKVADAEPAGKPAGSKIFQFEMDAGIRMGGSFLQDSANYREFHRGFIAGPELGFQVLRVRVFRFGFTTGYFFYTDERRDGTDEITVNTVYQRVDFQGSADLILKAFILNLRAGAGIAIFKTEIMNSISQNPETFSNTGARPGFLGGLGTGVEFGKHLFHLKKNIYLFVQSDWLRRDHRNDFTLFGLLSFELFNK
jgi:hypothetical protein